MLSIKARISFLTTEEGGIKTALLGSTSCRPNHNFGNRDCQSMYIGQINFEKDDIIMPGDEREVEVVFIDSQSDLKKKLIKGLVWRIQAGEQLIAMAEVLSLEDNTLELNKDD